MILTYKLKHNYNLSDELSKARMVAQYALKTGSLSSKDVNHIGLKSIISNQVLRKYSRNKKIKTVRNVKLTIPAQGIKYDKDQRRIRIPCLKLEVSYQFANNYYKINQIEADNTYLYISVTVPENDQLETASIVGIDLNTTGHVAVLANLATGKVKKLGKKASHIHKKYKAIRKSLQKSKKYKRLKKIKNRESRITKDINHKISRTIVNIAHSHNATIAMEDLKGIRHTAKTSKSNRYALHSWSYYQLRQLIVYKAKLLGIPITFVPPQYTSQMCSRCGRLGNRDAKRFKCPHCGHVDHADVNAAFNIGNVWLNHMIARDTCEGNTDIPKVAMGYAHLA